LLFASVYAPLSAAALKEKAVSFGLEVTGTKSQLIDSMLKAAIAGKKSSSGFVLPKSIVSIDVGLKNLAFSAIEKVSLLHYCLLW